MNKFVNTFEYKLIYVFRINDEAHKGLLKIGDATVHLNNNVDVSELTPNCEILNESAKDRINSYTTTAGIEYELLHTELAKDNKNRVFRDYNVHEVLIRSGYERHYFNTEKKQNEWFKVNLETVLNSIKVVKKGLKSLNNSEVSTTTDSGLNKKKQLKKL